MVRVSVVRCFGMSLIAATLIGTPCFADHASKSAGSNRVVQPLALEAFFTSHEESPRWIDVDGATDVVPVAHHTNDCLASDPCLAMGCDQVSPWCEGANDNCWIDLKTDLARQGIGLNFKWTQFYNGIPQGGRTNDWEYGGKVDYFVALQGEPLGLNKGFSVIMHAETRYGNGINGAAREISAPTANLLFPSTDDVTAITGLTIQQALSPEWVVSLGKFNTIDLFDQLFGTGRGVTGFQNTSLVLPLGLARTVPYATLGASLLKLQDGKIQGSIMVFDPNSSATTSGFDNFFEDGAGILGLWRFFTNFGGKEGSHTIGGVWSSQVYTSVDPADIIEIPGQGLALGKESGSWAFFYVIDQNLWTDACAPHRKVNFLSMFSLADESPNPIRWTATAGLTAQGLLRHREHDTIGAGYYFVGLNGTFKQLLQPVVPLENAQGVELYYRAQVLPNLHITGDVQFIHPNVQAQETTIVTGVRAELDF